MVCDTGEVFTLNYLIHCAHSGNLHCVSLQIFYLLPNPNLNVGGGDREAAQHVRKGHQEFSVICLTDISHNTVFTGATSCNLGNGPSKKPGGEMIQRIQMLSNEDKTSHLTSAGDIVVG